MKRRNQIPDSINVVSIICKVGLLKDSFRCGLKHFVFRVSGTCINIVFVARGIISITLIHIFYFNTFHTVIISENYIIFGF